MDGNQGNEPPPGGGAGPPPGEGNQFPPGEGGVPAPGGENLQQKTESVKNKKPLYYEANSIGPYQVMIESMKVTKKSISKAQTSSNPDPTDTSEQMDTSGDTITKVENLHVGNFSHLSVAKTILDMKLNNVLRMEKKGRNRLCITFKTRKSANDFLNNEVLLNQGYSMFVPANLVSCKGIIRNVDKSFSVEELLEYSTAQGTKIINIKRLDRRRVNDDGTADFVPTTTVLFSFSGKILPKFVDICMLPMPVEPYILPVIQCQSCFLFGHTKKKL